jgi:sensor domain CHASE-containing protein
MMPREQAATLKPGERVRVLVDGCGDVEGEGELSFAAGEILTVDRVDTYRDEPQGLSVIVYADNGVVNVFDETDYGGLYPFERLAPPEAST